MDGRPQSECASSGAARRDHRRQHAHHTSSYYAEMLTCSCQCPLNSIMQISTTRTPSYVASLGLEEAVLAGRSLLRTLSLLEVFFGDYFILSCRNPRTHYMSRCQTVSFGDDMHPCFACCLALLTLSLASTRYRHCAHIPSYLVAWCLPTSSFQHNTQSAGSIARAIRHQRTRIAN